MAYFCTRQAKANEKMMMILAVMVLEQSGIRGVYHQQPNFTRFQKENSLSPRGIWER